MYNAAIELTFEAGHRLLFYQGQCESPHGHTFKVEIVVTAGDVDRSGFAVDFLELKDRIGHWINDNWDHAFLVNRQDQEFLQALNSLNQKKIFIFESVNPTAENLSRYLHDYVRQIYRNLPVKVRVWEGLGQYAEYSEKRSNA